MDEKADSKMILLVDDEADFRQLLGFWLQSQGYRVSYAEDGAGAVEAAKSAKAPDIILMDLRMPKMGGVEAIGKIREFNRDIPIIIISAHVQDPMVCQIPGESISGVFYKGADFKESIPLLHSVLRTHKKMI